jgi:nitrite reductase/ring-hydroxylating ferredoxin subunit
MDPQAAWIDVGAEADQAPGTGRAIEVAGRRIALFRTDAGWFALEDRCPHLGAPLSAGCVRDGHVVCGWHGWRFDLATGACPVVAGAPGARPVPVRVAAGRVLVAV